MKPTTLLKIGSTFMTSRKGKIIFVAIQLGYLAYKYIKDEPEEDVQELVK